MFRRALMIGATVAIGVLAFAATSFALGGDPQPRFRDNLPAAQLPAAALDATEAARISNLADAGTSVAGLTAESYSQARLISQTAAGPLHVIPGTRGACLSLGTAVGCGDPGAPGTPFNALATVDRDSQTLVGGGVADASVRSVEVLVDGQSRGTFAVTRGVFSFAVPAFPSGSKVNFVAH
jgi:hypothetical protein